jgi:rubredoxin
MDKYECNTCNWSGTEEELVSIMESNRHNEQDHTLYEVRVCPECKTSDDLVNKTDEEYERMAHLNYYKNEL